MLPRSHQLTLLGFSISVLLAEGCVPDVSDVCATSFFRHISATRCFSAPAVLPW